MTFDKHLMSRKFIYCIVFHSRYFIKSQINTFCPQDKTHQQNYNENNDQLSILSFGQTTNKQIHWFLGIKNWFSEPVNSFLGETWNDLIFLLKIKFCYAHTKENTNHLYYFVPLDNLFLESQDLISFYLQKPPAVH